MNVVKCSQQNCCMRFIPLGSTPRPVAGPPSERAAAPNREAARAREELGGEGFASACACWPVKADQSRNRRKELVKNRAKGYAAMLRSGLPPGAPGPTSRPRQRFRIPIIKLVDALDLEAEG